MRYTETLMTAQNLQTLRFFFSSNRSEKPHFTVFLQYTVVYDYSMYGIFSVTKSNKQNKSNKIKPSEAVVKEIKTIYTDSFR